MHDKLRTLTILTHSNANINIKNYRGLNIPTYHNMIGTITISTQTIKKNSKCQKNISRTKTQQVILIHNFVMPSYTMKKWQSLFFPHGFINRIKALSTHIHTALPRITSLSLFDEMKRKKINWWGFSFILRASMNSNLSIVPNRHQ